MSNQPPPYNRQYNFEDYQSLNPTTPLPGDKVEAELNAARSSVNQTISRLNEIQNADGSLKVPGALAAETTATATSVATTVATTTAANYLAANYDPTVATQAAASASDAASWAADAANSKQLAEAHMNNAEAAGLVAQNAAIDSAIARSESRSHAIDANQSRNEAHASAQAAAASYADVGQVYGSALSLKNWIDSQAYQFVHKREETSHIAANMLFNDGDANNTLIGKIFQGAEMDANSKVTYPGPINNFGYNFAKGPWWVVGNPAPENPEKIIMRDMMNCLVHTWLAFGPSVATGEMKAMQVGVNGQPNDTNKSYDFVGKLIRPVIYTQQDFNTQINSPISQTSALTPKGYVDQKIAFVTSMAQQADSTANTARDEVQQFRTQEYDNSRVYGPHEIVKFGDKLYWFNDFIGAAGYGPITHPAAWTELTGDADLTGYATESFVTSQGYLTAVPAGYATENFVTTRGYLTAVPSGYVQLNQTNGINIGGVVNANGGFLSEKSYNYPVNIDNGTSGRTGTTTFALYNNNPGSDLSLYLIRQDSVTNLDGANIPLPSHNEYSQLLVRADIITGSISSSSGDGSSSSFSIHKGGISVGENEGIAYKSATFGPSGFSFNNGEGYEIVFNNLGLRFADGTMQNTAFNSSTCVLKTGGTFTGKVNFTPVAGAAGLNIGIGGVQATANVAGDMWIATGGTVLNYRDATGAVRIVAALNNANQFTSGQAITVNSTSNALRINQTGTGPALVVEDSNNPDTTSLVVDSSGNVGIGVAAGFSATSKLEVVGNVKATTLSTGSGPTFSLNSTSAHTGGSDTLDAIVTINGVNYRIGLRPA